MLVSVLVAGALYWLLNRTRIGVAMRASVDNPDLLKLFGGRPDVVSAMAWAIGISLAGLGGMLLAPTIGMNYFDLTLLVITAYAAAMLGKLKSLPLTFAGAMGLGLMGSYAVGYLPSTGSISGLKAVIPTIFLFVVIVLMPQAQLRVGQVKGIISAPVPSLRKAGLWGVLTVVFVAVLTLNLSRLQPAAGRHGGVLRDHDALAGPAHRLRRQRLARPVRLRRRRRARLREAGLPGPLRDRRWPAWSPRWWVPWSRCPVLRLTGLYLALATLAFAQLMDKLIFQASFAFKFNGILDAKRMSLLGFRFTDLGSYVLLVTIFFVAMAVLLLLLRRGRLGPGAHRHA